MRRVAGIVLMLGLAAGEAGAQEAARPAAIGGVPACPVVVVRKGRTASCQAVPGGFAAWRPGPFARASQAGRHGFGFTEGLGLAYPEDPLRTPVAEVPLPRLYDDGARLDGRYVRVSSARLNPDDAPLPSRDAPGDFRYPPDESGTGDCIADLAACDPFDAVNVYYHLDRFAHTFWTGRMGLEPAFQADVVTHISGDGGFADGARNLIKLGVGNLFMKNAAREDDLLYHEYTHLVTYALGFAVDIGTPVEARALNEGYADYFAATFTGDPRIGVWVVTCPDRRHCTGPPNDTEFRTLATDPAAWNWRFGAPADTLKYGVCTRFHEGDGKCKTSYNNFADQYVWGMIWAGALWDLREALGADVTDRLTLEGLRLRHGQDLTFATALAGLLEADALVYGGQHEGVIRSVFEARGMRPAATAVAVEEAPGETVLRIEAAFPNPFRDRTAIRYTVPAGGPASVRVYDVLGREVARLAGGWQGPGSHTVTWDAAGRPVGLYVVQVRAAGGHRSRTLVRMR